MSGSAMYVGRVGALAVALGVGMAVATGQGVAWATDEGTDGGGAANSAADSAPAFDSGGEAGGPAGAGEQAAPDHTGASEPDHGTSATPAEPGAPSPTEDTVSVGDDVVIRSSGGALTSGDTKSRHERRTAPALDAKSPRQQVVSPQVTTDAPEVSESSAVREVEPAQRAAANADRSAGPVVSAARTASVTALAPAPPQPNPVTAFLAVPAAALRTVTGVVAAVLSSFTTPAPGAPSNPPLLWAVAEVVRREFFNRTPTFGYTVSTPDASGAVTISLDHTDADGDSLVYRATGGAKGTAVVNADGHSVTYTPAAGAAGTDTVTITASDASSGGIHGIPGLLNALTFGLFGDPGDTSSAAVVVTINNAPEFSSVTSSTDGAGKVTGTVVFTDPDGDSLTYSGSGATAKGTVEVDPAGAFTYTPGEDARFVAAATAGVDSDTFTVTVTDGHGATVTKDVTVTVTPADISTNAQAAVTAAEQVISAQVDDRTDAKARLIAELRNAGARATGTELDTLVADVRADATVLSAAQAAANTVLAASAKDALVARLEQATGLTYQLNQAQVDALIGKIQGATTTMNAADNTLMTSLGAAADAGALITGTASESDAPVFSRLVYNADANGVVIGRFVFVTAAGHPLTYADPGPDFPTSEEGVVTISPDGTFTFAPHDGTPLPVRVRFLVQVTDSVTGVSTYPPIDFQDVPQTALGSYDDVHQAVVDALDQVDLAAAERQAAEQRLVDAMTDGVTAIGDAQTTPGEKPSLSDSTARALTSTMTGLGTVVNAGLLSGTTSGLAAAASAQDAMKAQLEASAKIASGGQNDEQIQAMRDMIAQITSKLADIAAANNGMLSAVNNSSAVVASAKNLV